jgi:PhnB protein
MIFDLYLFFDGDCRAAMDFYAKVFGVDAPTNIMTYGQNPGGSSAADQDRVLYAAMPLFGMSVMFSDIPSGREHVKGTNITLSLGTPDADELRRVFAALADGGEVLMPLGPQFFNELYAMVRDRFEVTWQLGLAPQPSQGAA